MDALQYFLSRRIGAMGDFSNIFHNFVILNHIYSQICDILLIECRTSILENLQVCNKTWKELVDTSVEYGYYLDLIMLLPLSKGAWIRLAKRPTCKWSLPIVSGKTTIKLKHTLKDAMSLLPRHRGVFSPLECMMKHHLSHALPCTNLECI
jgi:hypothetical protein